MARFQWEATTRTGEKKRGVMEADSAAQARARLRGDGLTIGRVRKEAIPIAIGSGVGRKDLKIFTRQLATMIDAGLPLVQCLDILATQTPNKRFARVLGQVKSAVERGAAFSDALRRHPRVFDELYVNLVAAGEVGGVLDTILSRLAVYLEKAVKLRGQIKSAMLYPLGILVVAIGVIAVMLLKVIPTFEDMYQEMGQGGFPAATRLVIQLSHGFVRHGYVYAGVLFGVAVGSVVMRRTDRGGEIFDRVLLHLPVLGGTLRKIAVARFTRTLGTLLPSGVPILDALDICGRAAGNKVVEHAIQRARDKIAEGQGMASPLAESRVFPAMVVQMIGVGEQTGAMDPMLQKIADYYEEEVDAAVSALTSLIEPVMMAFLGVVVGGLIIAMYLPIFKLAGSIQAG